MDVLSDRQWFGLAVVLYAASTVYSVFLWRKGFRRDEWVNYVLLAVAWVSTTIAMLQRGFTLHRCPVFNLFEATMFVMWVLVGALLILGLIPRLRFIGAFAAPVLLAVGVFALIPDLDRPHGPRPEFTGAPLSLHITLVLLAYGAFGVSCVAGLIYLNQDRNLKLNKARALASVLPPVQRLERIVGEAMLMGFLLLTLGLAIGAAFFYVNRDSLPSGADTKIIWSVIVWVTYMALLIARWRFAPGGRRLAWGAVCGFAFIMLTFWGTNLLSPLHQS